MASFTITNSARERLARGEVALGFGVRLAKSAEIAKAAKTAGFDWLFIDLEHSALSIETASQLAIAALEAGIAPIARVPKGEYSLATRLLDNGVLGIIVPHIDTADEAREVATACVIRRRATAASSPACRSSAIAPSRRPR
jgi:2-keto-3-deoxy-L-rhamnonate aldolase RhmA